MLVKFEENRIMVQTAQILRFLTKKTFLKPFLTKPWRHFEKVFATETIYNAKSLISRLLSFSVPKITVVDTCNQVKSCTKHGRSD